MNPCLPCKADTSHPQLTLSEDGIHVIVRLGIGGLQCPGRSGVPSTVTEHGDASAREKRCPTMSDCVVIAGPFHLERPHTHSNHQEKCEFRQHHGDECFNTGDPKYSIFCLVLYYRLYRVPPTFTCPFEHTLDLHVGWDEERGVG
jgi:hypothetical protein